MIEVTDPNILAQLNTSQAAPPASNIAVQDTQPQQGLKEVTDSNLLKQLNDTSTSLGSKATAVVAGAANTAADILETGTHGTLWLAEKLGLADPTISQSAKKAISSDLEKYVRSGADKNTQDVFTKAAKENPKIAKTTQYGLDTALLLKTGTPIKGLGTLGNIGVQTAANIPIAAGMAGPNSKDQNLAATIAGVATPIIGGLSALAVKGAKSGYLGEYIKKQVSKANSDLLVNGKISPNAKTAESISNLTNKVSEIETSNYNVIKSIPGTIESKSVLPALTSLSSATKLGEKQAAVLDDLAERLSSLSTMEDAIKLKQELSAQSKFFTPQATTGAIANNYKILRGSVDDAINLKAKEAGVEGAWTSANKFHREVVAPLQDSGAYDIAKAYTNRATNPAAYADEIRNLVTRSLKSPEDLQKLLTSMDSNGSKIIQQSIVKQIFDDAISNPENFNKNKALISINKYITKLDRTLSSDSIKALEGIKKVLKEAGAMPTLSKEGADSTYAQHVLGAVIGGGAVGAVTGSTGAGLGAAAGIYLLPKALQTINNLLHTPVGLVVLKGMAEGKPWSKELGKALNKGIGISPGAYIGPDSDQQINP